MNQGQRRLRIQRILIALDASPADASVLAAAIELAARFQSELLGLFVENADLFTLTGDESVSAVDALFASECELDSRMLERQLRAQAARVRRTLTSSAERRQVSTSFQVVRGKVTTEVLREAAKADVLVLGRGGWAVSKSRRLSPVARRVLSQATVPTLLVHPDSELGFPILVAYDGSKAGDRALYAAAELAEKDDGELVVLILSDAGRGPKELLELAADRLDVRPRDVRHRVLELSTVSDIASLIRRIGGGTLVLPAKSSVLRDDALESLLDQVELPVLLAR